MTLSHQGWTIDPATDEVIRRLFPDLRAYRDVLDRMCQGARQGSQPGDSLLQDLFDLVNEFWKTVRDLAGALAHAGIDEKVFKIEPPEEVARGVVKCQFAGVSSGIDFQPDPDCRSAALELWRKTSRLRSLLSQAPVTVLAPVSAPSSIRPRLDREKRELWFGDRLCKKFDRQAAPNQLLILETFEDYDWSTSIPDPLPRPRGSTRARQRDRLKNAVTGLNSNPDSPILFRRDGTGEGVSWEPHLKATPISP